MGCAAMARSGELGPTAGEIRRRPGGPVLCLPHAGLWRGLRAWAEPLPSAIELQGPIGADATLDFWVGGAAMAVPLAVLSGGAAAAGSQYLSRVRCAWQAWAGWVAAVTAAVTAEVMFIGL